METKKITLFFFLLLVGNINTFAQADAAVLAPLISWQTSIQQSQLFQVVDQTINSAEQLVATKEALENTKNMYDIARKANDALETWGALGNTQRAISLALQIIQVQKRSLQTWENVIKNHRAYGLRSNEIRAIRYQLRQTIFLAEKLEELTKLIFTKSKADDAGRITMLRDAEQQVEKAKKSNNAVNSYLNKKYERNYNIMQTASFSSTILAI